MPEAVEVELKMQEQEQEQEAQVEVEQEEQMVLLMLHREQLIPEAVEAAVAQRMVAVKEMEQQAVQA